MLSNILKGVAVKRDMANFRNLRDKAIKSSDKANDLGKDAIAGTGDHAKACAAHAAAAQDNHQASMAASDIGSSNAANFHGTESYKHSTKATAHAEWAGDAAAGQMTNGDAST